MKYSIARELITIEEEEFQHQRRLQFLRRLTLIIDSTDNDDDEIIEQRINQLQDEYYDVAELDRVIAGLNKLKSRGQ
jgi:3-deoxy-D-manno-octulosonic-acid transferase